MDAGTTNDQDAGQSDAGQTDAGKPDAGPVDAGSTDAGKPDAGPVDAGSTDAGGAVDAGPSCHASASYGSLGMLSGYASQGSNSHFSASLNADVMPDKLFIDLWDGYGVFAAGVAPGTYALTGDETSYDNCGACVMIIANVDPSTADGDQYYFATGGTLTITQVDGGMAGSLSNVTFQHVTDADWNVPANDGCFSAIGSASFNQPYSP